MCQFHPDLARALIEERQYREHDRQRTQNLSGRRPRQDTPLWQARQRTYVLASLVGLRKGDESR